MPALLADTLSGALIAGGVVFMLIGSLGILRLPDIYSRLHGAGLTDTLGSELILAGLMVEAGWSFATLKLAFIAIVLLITSPTAAHALASAAWTAGLRPYTKTPGKEDTL